LGGTTPDIERDLARLAHHAEAAGDREAVLEFAIAAAEQAAGLHAHREAAAQYARALRFADTLPAAERAAGYAEVVKTALIAGGDLWARVRGGEAPDAGVILGCLRTKLAVVAEDERDQGRRQVLNLGHTVGHALEAATGYEALLHGEAVAVGMAAAAQIAHALGLLSDAEVERQNRLIARFGLPLRAPGVDLDAVLAAMSLDKKVSGKSLRWILLDGLGRTVIRDDVPMTLVREAVQRVTAPEPA